MGAVVDCCLATSFKRMSGLRWVLMMVLVIDLHGAFYSVLRFIECLILGERCFGI